MDAAFTNWMERHQLHFAAGDGNVREVSSLLAEGCPLNAFDNLGKTPLHYAVAQGHQVVAEALLAAGADVNAVDLSKAGDSPLGGVAQECSLEIAKFLLDHGADPQIPGMMQVTPLQRAERRVHGDGPAVVRAMWDAIKQRKL
jgi:ankyrin repeat protein